MADNIKIGGAIALDGEAEFKKAVSGINKELTVLGSEMKKVTAQFSDNADSLEALTAKQKVYNDRADEQRKKVEVLSSALANAKKEFGENADKVKEWQIKLNNAEADLAKTESSLKDTTNKIENFGKEANTSGDKVDVAGIQAKQSGDNAAKGGSGWSKLGSSLKNIGEVAAKAAAAAATAITAVAVGGAKAIYDTGKATGDWADELLTLSAQTGLSTKQLQEFQYAARFVDVEVETMTNSMAKNIKSMKAVQDGTALSVDAYKKLGVEVLNADGSMRDGQTVYFEVIDALGKMTNETERDALAMQVLGKSAQDLNPLIKAGSSALKSYGDEAKKMGLILDENMIKKMGEFDDVMEKSEAQMDGLKKQIAVNFLPALMTVGKGLSGVMTEISKSLSDGFQPEDIKTIGSMISKKLVDGIKTFSKYIPDIVSTLSGTLTEVVNVLVTLLPTLLPALMDAALQLMQGVLDALVANIEPLTNMVVQLITSISMFILENLPTIIDAALQIVISLANGIVEAIPELIPAIVDCVMKIVDVIMSNLPKLVETALQIILALVQGLIDALPRLIEWLPTIINTMIDIMIKNLGLIIDATIQIIVAIIGALIENLPLLIKASLQIMIALMSGLIRYIPELLKAIPKIFMALINKFKEIDWGKLGRQIWDGITEVLSPIVGWFGKIFGEAWSAVKGAFSAVGGFFSDLWDTIKSKFSSIGLAIGGAIGDAFKYVVNGVIGFAENTINGFIKAINAAIGLINAISGVEISKISLLNIPKLETGTNYVPQDMMAYLHKGEAVVPAKYNEQRQLPKIEIKVQYLVGTGGMKELSNILSKNIAGQYGLSVGGAL